MCSSSSWYHPFAPLMRLAHSLLLRKGQKVSYLQDEARIDDCHVGIF